MNRKNVRSRRLVLLIVSASILALAGICSAADEGSATAPERLTSCRTASGTLSAQLVITHTQGGEAGPVGAYTLVEPEGAWQSGNVFKGRREPPKESGQLSPESLASLSAELDRLDLLTLPRLGKVYVNPSEMSISFGSFSCAVQRGEEYTDPAEKAIRERYRGIERAVRRAITGVEPSTIEER